MMVETGLLRTNVLLDRMEAQKMHLAEELRQVKQVARQLQTEKLRAQRAEQEARSHLDYVFWTAAPSMLDAPTFPRVDLNLEEAPDGSGSIGELAYVRELGIGRFGKVHMARSSRTAMGQELSIKKIEKS